MRTGFIAFAIGCISAMASAQDSMRDEIAYAKSKVYPALVNIAVLTKDFSGGRTQRSPSAGSGTIISPAGHIITNYHVIENAVRITCTLPDGESVRADIIGQDPETDLGVLQLRLLERKNPSAPLPFATLGDSDRLEVGDQVLAAGNPMALSSSLTAGIVSNRERVFTNFLGTEIEDLSIGAQQTGMFTQWIQHDALILPGNSGGPLLDLRGEIIGINTRGGSGVAFAAPSNLAKKVISQILTNGSVHRGWLGVSLTPVSRMGLTEGALVSSISPDSPADQGGLKPGDVLLSVAGHPVHCQFIEQVPLVYGLIADQTPGSALEISYLRDGETHVTEMTLKAMEAFAADEVELNDVGLTAMDITKPMALLRRLKSDDGIMITGIRPGQPIDKARPRIAVGDIITAVGKTEIKDMAQFSDLIAERGEVESLAVRLVRHREEIITVILFEDDAPRNRGTTLPNAWVGVKTQVLTTKVAEALGMENTRGFRITEVFPGTAAFRSGILVGDILTKFDGEELDAYREQDAGDWKTLIEEYPVGESVDIEVLRSGETLALSLELQDSPRDREDADKGKDDFLECSVRELVFLDRVSLELSDDVQGVLVTECTSGGWASMSGLRPGDLILSINGEVVSHPEAFETLLKELKKSKPELVTIFVRRGISTAFVFVEPDWQ